MSSCVEHTRSPAPRTRTYAGLFQGKVAHGLSYDAPLSHEPSQSVLQFRCNRFQDSHPIRNNMFHASQPNRQLANFLINFEPS